MNSPIAFQSIRRILVELAATPGDFRGDFWWWTVKTAESSRWR
jgi:hypothetical protein